MVMIMKASKEFLYDSDTASKIIETIETKAEYDINFRGGT